MSGKIRNIQQSVQHREVVKQASDVVVYIDGQDYMINRFLGGVPGDEFSEHGQVVPFNDYLLSWQSSNEINMSIPNGTMTLSVPVHLAHLFCVPGGNYILKTMSEIRVFAKGYYLSINNNSVYRQIFKGYITSISYVPDGMTLTITVNCAGSLGLLEKMQIELQPSLQSASPQGATPHTSTNWNMNPYMAIAYVFLYSSMVDGFDFYSLQQASMSAQGNSATGFSDPYYYAAMGGYAAKWQAYLYELARDVHVFGVPPAKEVLTAIRATLSNLGAAQEPENKVNAANHADKVGTDSRSANTEKQRDFYEQLREYMPDMGFTSIQLINGRTQSRLERLRYYCNLVGFEMYQDIDGAIIVKPPLYNLDVLDLEHSDEMRTNASSFGWITDATNPFVVQQSEILTEAEGEDEGAVRLTRLLARGSVAPWFPIPNADKWLSVAGDIDLGKLAQFGLRTEAPHLCEWFSDDQPEALFAYAASELARVNRGFRHYTVTIPLRPEIKLGMPMYFPHKDIYGYIKSVAMSWTRGSSATTSITLDSLRRRPLFPVSQTVKGENDREYTATLMTPQVNLVTQWTKVDETAEPAGTRANPQLLGGYASLPYPQQLVVDQQLQVSNLQMQAGDIYGPNPDDANHCWRIQMDNRVAPIPYAQSSYDGASTPPGDSIPYVASDAAAAGDLPPGGGVFDHERRLNAQYYEDLRTYRPYTDRKGYELVGPFPWGRWKSLKDCLTIFTVKNYIYNGTEPAQPTSDPVLQVVNPIKQSTEKLSDASAFLFTADDPGGPTTGSAMGMIAALTSQAAILTDFKSFELVYSPDPASSQGTLPSSLGSHEGLGADAEASRRARSMMSGRDPDNSLVQSILRGINKAFTSIGGSSHGK